MQQICANDKLAETCEFSEIRQSDAQSIGLNTRELGLTERSMEVYLEFVERRENGAGYAAKLVGLHGPQHLSHKTLSGLKMEVLRLCGSERSPRVDAVFKRMAEKGNGTLKLQMR